MHVYIPPLGIAFCCLNLEDSDGMAVACKGGPALTCQLSYWTSILSTKSSVDSLPLLSQQIDLADASVILATSTIWTAIMAYFVEKGSWNRVDSIAAALCLCGIILVTRPIEIFGCPHHTCKGGEVRSR